MSVCGNCGHGDPHGRRGFGSCSHRDLTEYGAAEIARLDASTKNLDPFVRRAVLGCAIHIPGMTVGCECKRKTKRKRERSCCDPACVAVGPHDVHAGLTPRREAITYQSYQCTCTMPGGECVCRVPKDPVA